MWTKGIQRKVTKEGINKRKRIRKGTVKRKRTKGTKTGDRV